MSNKNKAMKSILSSTAGVVIVAVILLLVCFIFKNFTWRLDFTEDKLYTLSDATKQTLGKLDKNITIRFYYSKNVSQMPVNLKNYAQKVDDMLREYEIYSNGHLRIEKLNPQPDTDAEDSANLDGVTGQSGDALGLEDNIYLGLAIRCADAAVALPFLSPDRESFLEYDITRAIVSVSNPVKHKIGVMSTLKVFGGVDDPAAMMQGQGGMKPAWFFINELKKEYSVAEVQATSNEIPADIDILLVIHPKDFSDQTLFALDQFLLRGGRLVAFMDPQSVVDLQNQPRNQMQYMPPNASSTLGKLMAAWGVDFQADKVVLDRTCATAIRQRANAAPEQLPNVLSLDAKNLARNEPATAQLSLLIMLNAGAFTGTPAEGLAKSVLLYSSDDSQLVEKYMTERNGTDMLRDFKSDEKAKELAIRLTGNFKTAFPEGKPVPAPKEGEKDSSEPVPEGGWLKASTKPGAVVLFGDVDMLYDAFCVRSSNIFGQTVYQPLNHNISLVQNIVENMAGDSSLFAIRSRGVKQRPFTKVKELELASDSQYRDEIKKFEAEVQNFQRELYDMQQKRNPGEKELLSKEQKEAVAKIRKKEAEARKKLKEVRKNMRKDIESLENNVMFLNIALMPFLVVLGGISLAIVKRMRMSAK